MNEKTEEQNGATRGTCGVRLTPDMLHGQRIGSLSLPDLARESAEDKVHRNNVAQSPLRRVEWLAALLDLSPCQTYDAIASKQVPDDCVVRIGRRLRIIEARVNAWLGLDQFGGQRLQTGT